MLVRIVKMTFQKDKAEEFLQLFNSSMQNIMHFPSCMHLELLQNLNETNIYYTYSHWTNEEALNIYRNSEVFKITWGQTKLLFSARPEAFSLQTLLKVD